MPLVAGSGLCGGGEGWEEEDWREGGHFGGCILGGGLRVEKGI